MDKIKNKNTKLIIIFMLVGLLIIGGTYALLTFDFTGTNSNYTVAAECFKINYNIDNDDGTQNIEGTLLPSSIPSNGLSGKVSIGIDQACNVTGTGTLKLHIDSSSSSELTKTVAAHCEDPATLMTLDNYKDSNSCTSNGGNWIDNGTALKYGVYNNSTATGNPLSVGYIKTENIGTDIVIYDDFLVFNSQLNFYIFIWLDGYLIDNTYANHPFAGSVSAIVVQTEEESGVRFEQVYRSSENGESVEELVFYDDGYAITKTYFENNPNEVGNILKTFSYSQKEIYINNNLIFNVGINGSFITRSDGRKFTLVPSNNQNLEIEFGTQYFSSAGDYISFFEDGSAQIINDSLPAGTFKYINNRIFDAESNEMIGAMYPDGSEIFFTGSFFHSLEPTKVKFEQIYSFVDLENNFRIEYIFYEDGYVMENRGTLDYSAGSFNIFKVSYINNLIVRDGSPYFTVDETGNLLSLIPERVDLTLVASGTQNANIKFGTTYKSGDFALMFFEDGSAQIINDSIPAGTFKYKNNRIFDAGSNEMIGAMYPDGSKLIFNGSIFVVEPVAFYSYNGVVLPDINTVWTDKETYPYAMISFDTTNERYILFMTTEKISAYEEPDGMVVYRSHFGYTICSDYYFFWNVVVSRPKDENAGYSREPVIWTSYDINEYDRQNEVLTNIVFAETTEPVFVGYR